MSDSSLDLRSQPISVLLPLAAIAVGPIAKADQNTQQGFAYRGIERVMEAVGPALHAYGISTVPKIVTWESSEVKRGNDKPWRLITATVSYKFVGPTGDFMEAVVLAEGLDNADKAASKMMTMAYKSALLQVLGIGAGGPDPDGDSYHDETERGSTRARQAKPSAASKPRASKAPKGTAAVADEWVAALVEKRGAEHAAQVSLIVDRLNEIPDGPEGESPRADVKKAFVEQFGKPVDLEPLMLEEASAWVALAAGFGRAPEMSELAPDNEATNSRLACDAPHDPGKTTCPLCEPF